MIPAAATSAIPPTVQRAYVCWVAASGIWVVGGVVSTLAPSGSSVVAYVDGETLLVAALVSGLFLLLAAVVVLVARQMRDGRNWARIVLTVFGGLAILRNLSDVTSLADLSPSGGSFDVGAVVVVAAAVLTTVALAAALIQQWHPAGGAWFAPRNPLPPPYGPPPGPYPPPYAPYPPPPYPPPDAPPRNVAPQAGVGPDMGLEIDLHALLAAARQGVLATIKADGRPQLSPVTPFYLRDAGTILVSMTEGRAKTVNLRRDPRAALEVESEDGWSWATAEGTVELVGPGTDPHGPEVEALVAYYRAAAGEHPDWDEYRAAMVADRRVLMTMTVSRVYGQRLR